jgi:hypothetical protein
MEAEGILVPITDLFPQIGSSELSKLERGRHIIRVEHNSYLLNSYWLYVRGSNAFAVLGVRGDYNKQIRGT